MLLISWRNNRDVGWSLSHFNNYATGNKQKDVVGWGLITFLRQWQYTGKNWSRDNFERWLPAYDTWNSGGNRQNRNAGFSWLFLEAFGRKDDFLAGIYQRASKKGRKCSVVRTSLVFGTST